MIKTLSKLGIEGNFLNLIISTKYLQLTSQLIPRNLEIPLNFIYNLQTLDESEMSFSR